jgi:prepilin-type N-terminal cleavage/methylation domain-containing protein
MLHSSSRRRAFTLVELLVVIVIIALLASVFLGALAKTREVARADATKATVAKLNDLVMRKYESYMTRRVPLNLAGLKPPQAASLRLYALRDLMRMEMPERWNDVSTNPVPLKSSDGAVSMTLAQPALQQIYQLKYSKPQNYGMQTPSLDHAGAKCLYMWVMTAIPEARALFTGAEIGAVDGDGWPMFLDGWGRPICFLRWAPGYTTYSDIQFADVAAHHDPFDYRSVDGAGYQLFPLIYAGVLFKDNSGYDNYGISPGQNVTTTYTTLQSPCTANTSVGLVTAGGPPLVTNHHMEQK